MKRQSCARKQISFPWQLTFGRTEPTTQLAQATGPPIQKKVMQVSLVLVVAKMKVKCQSGKSDVGSSCE